jgi:hypothetical protein
MTTQTRTDTHETRTNSPSAHVVVHDKASLYVAVIAAVLTGVAIGALMMMPSLIDSKVAAGVAKSEATAQAAKEHGRIALSEVERANAELAAKGLIRKAEH